MTDVTSTETGKMPFSLATKARSCTFRVNRAAWTFDGLPIRGGQISYAHSHGRLLVCVTERKPVEGEARVVRKILPAKHENRVIALQNEFTVRYVGQLADDA
jgi:hypothetical protein